MKKKDSIELKKLKDFCRSEYLKLQVRISSMEELDAEGIKDPIPKMRLFLQLLIKNVNLNQNLSRLEELNTFLGVDAKPSNIFPIGCAKPELAQEITNVWNEAKRRMEELSC